MCELYIRVKDKIADDFYSNTQMTKRGDVISVLPDGWQWGSAELAASSHRIIKIPGMPVEEAVIFLGEEKATDPQSDGKTLQPRIAKFDLDSPGLPKSFADVIADDSRAVAAFVLQDEAFKASDFLSRRIVKQPIPDPAIIGDNPAVIG